MDPGEESFTLSSFDFNSSFGLYSSDEEEEEEEEDKRNKDDTDAYIELELPSSAMAPPPPPQPLVPSQVAASGDYDKELEFRISFSAVLPFPGFFPSSSINSANIVSSELPFCTREDANAELTAAIDSSPQPAVEPTLSCIHSRPITNHSTISIFPVAWTKFAPPVDDDYSDNCRRPVSDIHRWELVRSRKLASSKMDSATIGGIAKLLAKLRSVVIRGLGSMRASLARAGIASSQAQKRCPNSRRLTSMKPFERWLALCKPSERVADVRTSGVCSSSEMRSSSKVTEMKFEAMRKLFGSAVSPMKNSRSKSSRLNKSCPTSIKSSPVHQSGDASLVHAAIAHCKKSFGQNDDFSF